MLNTVKFGIVSPGKQNNSSVSSKPIVPAFRGGIEKVAVQVADEFVTKVAAELGTIKLVERARQATLAGEGDRAALLYKVALPKVLKQFGNEAEKVALYMTEMSQAYIAGANALFCGSVKAADFAVKASGKATNPVIKEIVEKNSNQINSTILATKTAQEKLVQSIAPQIIEANKIAEMKFKSEAKAVKAQVEALENQLKLQQLQRLVEAASAPAKETAAFGFKI